MAPLNVRSHTRTTAPRPTPPSRQPGTSPLPFGLPLAQAGLAQLPAGISLCMIVKNEERFIEQCLRSAAAHVDEICIVDTGSTDRTLEIAAQCGARVAHRPWRNDFAWARNEALALATKRWILVLDADEELDPASHTVLRTVRDIPAAHNGLWVRCNNLSDDYKGTGVSTHLLIRLFPNNPRIRYMSPVHEFITMDSSPTGLTANQSPLSITHHGYLSEIVKLRNKSERNLTLVKAATANDPSDPFNWYNLGTTSVLTGDIDAAIAAFETMREIVAETQRGFIPNALVQLADCYIERADYDRAIAMASDSLRKAPHFANAHFTLGRALAKLGRFADARVAFEAAIADAAHAGRQFIVDDEVSAWKAQSEIGSSYGYEGNDVAALAWFDRALKNRPNVVPVRMNRGKALERLGRYQEAASMFAGLARDEPGDAHSADYVNFLLRRNDYVAAALAIDTALPALTPRAQASMLVVAAKLVAHTGIGDTESLLERALRAHGGAADALEALEAWYLAHEKHDAVRRLREAELNAPLTTAADYARRGTRLLSAGQLLQAEAAIRAGLSIAPADVALHYNLAAVLVQTGHKEAALDELRFVGLAGDIGLRAQFLQAVVLGDLGRYEEAIAAIDPVISLAPHEVDARLHRFRFADALGRDGEAELTLRAALGLKDGRIAAELGGWLLRKGRFGDAQAVAERALATA